MGGVARGRFWGALGLFCQLLKGWDNMANLRGDDGSEACRLIRAIVLARAGLDGLLDGGSRASEIRGAHVGAESPESSGQQTNIN